MRWNQKKTPEALDKARSLLASGATRCDVAAELGVTRDTLRMWFDPDAYEKSKASHRRHLVANRKKYSAKAKANGYTPRGWAMNAVTRMKRRAKELGVPFDIACHDVMAAMPGDMKCPVLGVPLEFGSTSPHNPSLDRIIPERGYVKGNIAVISFRANTIKNDASERELQLVLDYITQRTFKPQLLIG